MSVKWKKDAVTTFKISEHDTGSVPIQVAMLTTRINHLTEHLKIHRKDFSSKRGLLTLVSRRRRYLRYLRDRDVEKYQEVIQRLNLRK